MNIAKLNVAANDNLIVKQKGGGGGVTINNQEKSLEITENGVTEVTADSGFTGLSKVIVNTNVASSGGGGGSDMPVIGDGKTYLYITIAAEGRMNVPLYFSQTVANGVTIDEGAFAYCEQLTAVKNLKKVTSVGDYAFAYAGLVKANLSGAELKAAIEGAIREKDGNLVGNMASQGTTPRRLTDLIGSLCDLTSGSGDKGTPIVLVQGYFDNYTN